MTRVVEVGGRLAVAGLSWINYQSSTVKGIDAKEGSFGFDAVAYLRGKGLDGKKTKILAGGYVSTEDQIADVGSPETSDLLKLPSLMLWVVAQVQKEDIASEQGVSGIFQIDLGDGLFWIGAVNNSIPLPFESSDSLLVEDQLQSEISDIREQALEIAGEMNVYELEASEVFSKKPSRSIGKITKGRSTTLTTTAQLSSIVVMFGFTGWMIVQILANDQPMKSSGPSDQQLRVEAMDSYKQAIERDFSFLNARQTYSAILNVTEAVPTQADNWEFNAVSCMADRGVCLFRYESPGYGLPSTLEKVMGTSMELNLGGQEALYRKAVEMRTEVSSDFEVPLSEAVRVKLLDAAAFLRSPALGLSVELQAPEEVRIQNASFLKLGKATSRYSKGAFSVSGPLGLMDVASEKLAIPGVVVTEVVINNNDFALRGHYAFN